MLNPATSISENICEVLCTWRVADLPQAVVEHAKLLLADTLFVARAGARERSTVAVCAWQVAEGGRQESTVWNGGARLPAPGAAFVNALAASVLDFDSIHRSVHPDAVTAASALAVAERQGSSGAEFLAAFIAGSELVCRLARSLRGPSRGWSQTATLGVFGAAIAAAKLLHLGRERTVNALGIALSMVSGTQQGSVEHVLTKHLQPALAARNGVISALAAQAGLTGPRLAFEGPFGLWSLVQEGDPDELFNALGTRYVMLETGLKKYPVCACSHAAVASCEKLRGQIGPGAAQAIDSVEVVISPFMNRLVGAPFNPAADAHVSAQFSVQYAVASVLLRGSLTLRELSAEAVGSPEIRSFAQRIRVTVDQGNQEILAPATVRIWTRDGRFLEHTTVHMPGGPDQPMSEADLDAKFRACADGGRSQMSNAELIAMREDIARIESLPDLSMLVNRVSI